MVFDVRDCHKSGPQQADATYVGDSLLSDER
jgi:hypothetical protein